MGISNSKEVFSVLKGCRKRLTLLLFVFKLELLG